jgi:hypothetical protein
VLLAWIDVEVVMGKCEGDQVGDGVQRGVRKLRREAKRRHKSKIWVQDVEDV